MQTEEILSTSYSKQTQPQSCPETSTANSRLVRPKGGFYEKLDAYNKVRRADLKFCLADFACVI